MVSSRLGRLKCSVVNMAVLEWIMVIYLLYKKLNCFIINRQETKLNNTIGRLPNFTLKLNILNTKLRRT